MSLAAIHQAFTQACEDHQAYLVECAPPRSLMREYAPALTHSTMSALFSLLADPPPAPEIDGATRDGLLRGLLEVLHLRPSTIEAILRLDTRSPEFKQYVQGLNAPLQ